MSEIRSSGDVHTQQAGPPQPNCDPLRGLIQSLREKQQREKTKCETEPATEAEPAPLHSQATG
jgi:hypothetical protein